MLIFYDAAVVPGEIIPCNFTIIKAMLLDVVVILIWYNHMKFLSFDYPHVSTTYRTCSCCPGFCFVSPLTTSSGSKILAPFTRCCKIYFQLLCGKGWGTRLLLIIGKKICYMNWNKCSNRAETSNLSLCPLNFFDVEQQNMFCPKCVLFSAICICLFPFCESGKAK